MRGATRLLAHQPPRAIVVEAAWTPGTPGPEGPTAVPDPAVADLLRGAGYILQHVRRSEGHTEERENFLAVYEGAERTDRLGALARGRE